MKWQDGKSKIVEVRRDFSIITVAQRLVRVGSEERDLFILGEANLPLLDQCQVFTTKHKSRSQG